MKNFNLQYFLQITSILFFITFAIYFIPQIDLPYKISYPAFILSLSILFLPSNKNSKLKPIVFALMFSFMGDIAGAMNKFIPQMLLFAVAHGAYLTYFMPSITKSNKKFYPHLILDITMCILYDLFTIPYITNPVEKYGMFFYGLLLTGVLFSVAANDGEYRIGTLIAAILFCISDCTLGFNKFVMPFKSANLVIHVTYFTAQYLFWMFTIKREIPEQKMNIIKA